MATKSAPLGTCPDCGSDITRGYLLIEYDTDDGSERFAECPACREIVHPAH